MQGPFTQRNVGGHSYRNTGMVLGLGQSFMVKPDAWYAFRTPSATNINYDLRSVFDLPLGFNLPRADFYRDEIAKRPLNVKNIKSTTISDIPSQTGLPPIDINGLIKNYVGNYDKDYQVLSVGGRDINNRYLITSGS